MNWRGARASFADPESWLLPALAALAWAWPQSTAGEWAVKSRTLAGVLIALGGMAALRAGGARPLAAVWAAFGCWLAASPWWSLDGSRSAVEAMAIGGAAAIVLARAGVPRPTVAAATLLLLSL